MQVRRAEHFSGGIGNYGLIERLTGSIRNDAFDNLQRPGIRSRNVLRLQEAARKGDEDGEQYSCIFDFHSHNRFLLKNYQPEFCQRTFVSE